MSYLKYFIRTTLIAIITLFGVIIITFFISRALPGDPVWYRLPEKATMEDYLIEKARLGLDKPIIYQFLVYMGDLLSGNWGLSLSITEDAPVWFVIRPCLTRSLEVLFISMFFATVLGIFFGKISAKKVHSFRDYMIRIIAYIFLSIPGFVIVIFFVQICVNTPYKIFPIFGFKTTGYPEPPTITHFRLIDSLLSQQWYLIIDYIWHLIIPVAAMTIIQMVATIRHTRSSILEVFQMDFIRTAKSKGCSKKEIIKNHVMKNSLPPVVTISAMGFPLILGGMVAIEIAYSFVGIGYLFRKSVFYKDYTIFIIIIFIFSTIVIIINFLKDLILGYLDPRIRLE